MTDLDKAYKIASKLSFMSVEDGAREKMGSPESVYTVELDGVEIVVGPFSKEYETWNDNYVWRVPDTDYGIMINDDGFDSWGTHYGDYGVEFIVVEIEPITVYKVKNTLWDNPNPMPKQGPRW